MDGDSKNILSSDTALLLVDIQNDFLPGGSLAVPDGEAVVPVANELAERFAAAGLLVITSRDWHPQETVHFKEFGGQWPPHCVAGTRGAAFHPDLQLPASTVVVSKGLDPNSDAYSAFDASAEGGSSLAQILEARTIKRLVVAGLATDYCVRWTVDEALRRGFAVTVALDGVRGVDAQSGDSEASVRAMASAGADLHHCAEIPQTPA